MRATVLSADHDDAVGAELPHQEPAGLADVRGVADADPAAEDVSSSHSKHARIDERLRREHRRPLEGRRVAATSLALEVARVEWVKVLLLVSGARIDLVVNRMLVSGRWRSSARRRERAPRADLDEATLELRAGPAVRRGGPDAARGGGRAPRRRLPRRRSRRSSARRSPRARRRHARGRARRPGLDRLEWALVEEQFGRTTNAIHWHVPNAYNVWAHASPSRSTASCARRCAGS